MGAMLVALLSAPLFHSHEAEDHGHHSSLVHAHFLEAEHVRMTSSAAVEENDHAQARWIDFFTFKAPESVSHAVITVSQTFCAPSLQEHDRKVLSDAPRAHGPPAVRSCPPRSPPSL
jgi:hypothetical protein